MMTEKKHLFFDTCSLLTAVNDLDEWVANYKVAISSITLQELERIKTSSNKDADVKYAARRLVEFFNTDIMSDEIDIVIFRNDMLIPIKEQDLDITDDMRILATAIYYDKKIAPDNTYFITNDSCLRALARLFFGNEMICSIEEDSVPYAGFLELKLNDEQMAEFYSNPNKNLYGLEVNEYINIKDMDDNVVDTRVWTGEDYRPIKYASFNSAWFGEVKPYKNDIYQAMLADSVIHNKITMVKGPAGSGKTYLSLAYLLSQLDRGKIDKIIVFCNTVATKNSARLGFYPGTRDEKLLDSQIGNLLVSKIGARVEVERMIAEEKLLLLPMSDIRGYDTTGMRAGIYISEAQNLDISLMKLALQRIGEDSICIIDGDSKTQVDDINYSGGNNGMRRVSKIFRGHDIYGEIELQQIHRSKIAQIAEFM